MKKLLMLAAAASLVATMANAQTTVTTTGAAPAAVQIEPQYRTKIKTYITENSSALFRRRKRSSLAPRCPAMSNLWPYRRIGVRPSPSIVTSIPVTA